MKENTAPLLALTYDDVLILPRYSEILPVDADVHTRLTRDLRINIPILSAAMDTVTEKNMAIAIGQQGGCGIIHKNMKATEQANQIRAVKRANNRIIKQPFFVHPNVSIELARKMIEDNEVNILMVTNEKDCLVGAVSRRDLEFEKNDKVPVNDVMRPLAELHTGDINTDWEKAETLFRKHRIKYLPLIDKDNKLTGLITFKDMTKAKRYVNRSTDSQGRLLVGAAVGVANDTMERVDFLMDA
jgi:IMP dehydrogenase